jgi:hypothetical protein
VTTKLFTGLNSVHDIDIFVQVEAIMVAARQAAIVSSEKYAINAREFVKMATKYQH